MHRHLCKRSRQTMFVCRPAELHERQPAACLSARGSPTLKDDSLLPKWAAIWRSDSDWPPPPPRDVHQSAPVGGPGARGRPLASIQTRRRRRRLAAGSRPRNFGAFVRRHSTRLLRLLGFSARASTGECFCAKKVGASARRRRRHATGGATGHLRRRRQRRRRLRRRHQRDASQATDSERGRLTDRQSSSSSSNSSKSVARRRRRAFLAKHSPLQRRLRASLASDKLWFAAEKGETHWALAGAQQAQAQGNSPRLWLQRRRRRRRRCACVPVLLPTLLLLPASPATPLPLPLAVREFVGLTALASNDVASVSLAEAQA